VLAADHLGRRRDLRAGVGDQGEPLDFTDAWILIGFIGIAITIVTGAFFLGPEAERLGKLGPERDPADPEIQRRIRRIFAMSRIDLVVLVLVVADMVFKPGG
jgi:hypothetical protein